MLETDAAVELHRWPNVQGRRAQTRERARTTFDLLDFDTTCSARGYLSDARIHTRRDFAFADDYIFNTSRYSPATQRRHGASDGGGDGGVQGWWWWPRLWQPLALLRQLAARAAYVAYTLMFVRVGARERRACV